MILATGDPESVAAQLTVWLKLRDLLIYRIRSSTFQVLKPGDWRSVLLLEVQKTKAGTRAGATRAKMQTLLSECLLSGHMQVSSMIVGLAFIN